MGKVSINETTLTNIGAAIREKTGKTDLIAPGDMPAEIRGIESGGGELPEEAFLITGDCSYKFRNGGWDWFINIYGNKVKTSDIKNMGEMFRSSNVESIPFELNLASNYVLINGQQLFSTCRSLREPPYINGSIGNMYAMFGTCENIREIPEDWASHIDWTRFHATTTWSDCRYSDMFYSCYSLRKVPESLLNQLWGVASSQNSAPNGMFNDCHSLDEIVGLRGMAATITGNMFSNCFNDCHRLKRLVFGMENGQPRVERWKSQTIDMTGYVGYVISNNKKYITNYNSGITVDKEVKDDATYAALKNDADWYTADINYSRYNHDSAVETINSLPDTSAYLASAGGTNTIKFRGASGALTDGGAINTLTEEEIAVATAKGWTVSLV